MNFFQVIFIVFCLFQFWQSVRKLHKTSKFIGVAFLIAWLSAIILLFDPAVSTRIANFLGVGRGADLILYLLVFLSLWGHYQHCLRYKRVENNLTTVVRQLALQNALIGKR